MSADEIDRYLDGVAGDGQRAALAHLRGQLRRVLPDAEEGMSYGMPAFRVGGKAVAGFAAFKKHLSYFPHSGSVIPALGDDAAPWATTKGTLQFAPDRPLPDALVERLVAVRLAELGR